LTAEPSAHRIQAWLGAQPADSLSISDWTIAEFSSALALKVRTRQLPSVERAASLAAFNRLVTESLSVLPVLAHHFRAAARYADHDDLAVRAADALHLAVAVDNGAVLYTLNRGLHEACVLVGAASELV